MIEDAVMYFSYINTWLVSALFVGVLFQHSAQRLYAAFVFSAIMYSHEYFMYDFDGIFYYGSAALFDVVAIMILGAIGSLSKMILRLQVVLFGLAIANFIGWAIWYAWLPPLFYNVICSVLFSAALITLILRDKQDVGGFTIDSWRSCFLFNNLTVFNFTFKREKKA